MFAIAPSPSKRLREAAGPYAKLLVDDAHLLPVTYSPEMERKHIRWLVLRAADATVHELGPGPVRSLYVAPEFLKLVSGSSGSTATIAKGVGRDVHLGSATRPPEDNMNVTSILVTAARRRRT